MIGEYVSQNLSMWDSGKPRHANATTRSIPTESGENGCGPEEVAHELRDAHQSPDTHAVHLLERVEHRHVARSTHLGRVHHTP